MCEICGGLGYVRQQAPVGTRGFGRLAPCVCKETEIRQRRMRRLVSISGMLEHELSCTLEGLIDRPDTNRMVDVALRFIDDPHGFLTVWGGVGNGKTLLLQAIVNELREGHGMEGAYVTFKDLIDFVRAGFNSEAFGERQRYDFLKDVEVLAIDEIDKARMTDYAAEFRSAFFDYRYRLGIAREAVTVFAMNCDPQELPMPIFDRLRDGRFTIFHNRDDSVRPLIRG